MNLLKTFFIFAFIFPLCSASQPESDWEFIHGICHPSENNGKPNEPKKKAEVAGGGLPNRGLLARKNDAFSKASAQAKSKFSQTLAANSKLKSKEELE